MLESYSQTPEVVPLDLETGSDRAWQRAIQATAVGILTLLCGRWMSRHVSVGREDGGEGRDASIDLVRTAAAFLVVFVHSFLAGGYYGAPLSGEGMAALTFLRWIALDCVPLFMLLTGYLCIRKSEIASTYLGAIPNLFLFMAVSMIRVVFWEGLYIGSAITWDGLLAELVGMESAWYMKMYAGLVLLMPFLNRLWAHLRQTEKQMLVAVLLLITMGRSVLGQIFPGYWVALYPLTYYFTGAYLRERTLPVTKRGAALLFVGVTLLETVLTHTAPAASGTFDWGLLGGFECSYNAAPVFASTVLLFSLLRSVKIERVRLQTLLRAVGGNTLGIYLVSGIVDGLVYPPLQRIFLTPQAFAAVQAPAAAVSFLISLAVSIMLTSAIRRMLEHFKKGDTNDVYPSIET